MRSIFQKLFRQLRHNAAGLETDTPVQFCVDRFVLFSGMTKISGWLWKPESKTIAMFLRTGRHGDLPISQYASSSPDVAASIDRQATHARFEGQWLTKIPSGALVDAKLVARFDDGSEFIADRLGARGLVNDPASCLPAKFVALMRESEKGSLLEIGSRARSGITRRHFLPDGWQYTGMDILAGKNVDVVGDAHQLSNIFPRDTFDAVMSFSVLEHLLMPWKVVIELNRVLRTGGLGIFSTHQSWPVHDSPWDFWRFSSNAWSALLNKATGFEIIESQMGEPGYVVANRCHAATNFSDQPEAFLASSVIFRKIGETRLEWKVGIDDVLTNSYPTTTTTLVASQSG